MIPGADVSLRNAWQRMLDAAESHHQPGRFTTLVGWEWSSNIPNQRWIDAAAAKRFRQPNISTRCGQSGDILIVLEKFTAWRTRCRRRRSLCRWRSMSRTGATGPPTMERRRRSFYHWRSMQLS